MVFPNASVSIIFYKCCSTVTFPPLVFILSFSINNNKQMGKSQEETMSNPFIHKDSKLHALTRAEEENCFKEMKAKALEACQLPIKGYK